MYNLFTFSWIFQGLNKKFRWFLKLLSKNYAIWLILECARAKTARKSWDLLHRSCWLTPQMATLHTSLRFHRLQECQDIQNLVLNWLYQLVQTIYPKWWAKLLHLAHESIFYLLFLTDCVFTTKMIAARWFHEIVSKIVARETKFVAWSM